MPKNGTVAYVSQPKLCDFHKREAEIKVRDLKIASSLPEAQAIMEAVPFAEYDFRTRVGYWANGCKDHWEKHRMYEDLGIGKGQKLEPLVSQPAAHKVGDLDI